jgi:hypothetical protein
MKKQVARFIASLFMCAWLAPSLAETPPDALKVIDLRPAEEKDGMGLLPLEGKCNKHVFRIADVATDPLKVEQLRIDLANHMGVSSDGKTLMVLNWSIYYNKQADHGGPKLGNIGLQGYGIPTGKKEKDEGSKCSRAESGGGWYEGKETTTTVPPLISEFSGTFGGKPYNIRIVHSVRKKIDGKFEGDANDTAELLKAVDKTAEALANAIVQ